VIATSTTSSHVDVSKGVLQCMHGIEIRVNGVSCQKSPSRSNGHGEMNIHPCIFYSRGLHR
jgi:hypothetical protein